MTTYEVRINGSMPPELIEQVGPIRTVRTAGTTLEVDVQDDAALSGLIDMLRSVGVDLLEIRRRSTHDGDDKGSP